MPTVIELFSGCGGMSTGLLDAGYRVAAGFDIDTRAIEAYNYNHDYRGSRGFVCDLSSATGEELKVLAGVNRVDLVAGGPPCQPFSIAGKRRGRDDLRANLITDFVRLVDELSPRAVFFENVPNLPNVADGHYYRLLLNRLRRLGYAVADSIVSAADFGVPQMRRRLLVIGIRGEQNPAIPKPTHSRFMDLMGSMLPYVTVSEAIGDLPDAAYFGACGIYNHEPTNHTADMLARFSRLKAGTRERGSFHDRLHPDRPSYTLRAGTGNYSPLRPVHYRFDRVVTVRESARLQGFSDDFIWPDSIPRLQQYRQVGNAVPPPLATAVGASIARQLRWRLFPDRFLGNPKQRTNPITLSDAEREAHMISRIRGASLGRSALATKKGA